MIAVVRYFTKPNIEPTNLWRNINGAYYANMVWVYNDINSYPEGGLLS